MGLSGTGSSFLPTSIVRAGRTMPKIAPRGTDRAVIVVAFAISVFENQTIASFEGTEMINP